MCPRRKHQRTVLNQTVTCLLGALVVACMCNAGAQTSASYQLTKSVMSGGGMTSTSASYSVTGTLGQPSPADMSESEDYNLGSGFWGATVRMFTVAIESISYSIAEGVRITWHSIAGASYIIEYTDALSLSTIWSALSPLPGTGGLIQWLDDGSETGTPPTAANILKRFYRLSGQP